MVGGNGMQHGQQLNTVTRTPKGYNMAQHPTMTSIGRLITPVAYSPIGKNQHGFMQQTQITGGTPLGLLATKGR